MENMADEFSQREWKQSGSLSHSAQTHRMLKLLRLDRKSPPAVIIFHASHYTVWQKQPVSFHNAIIHPLHVFCTFCRATSQTLIDPTLQRSMGTTVTNCGGILRYGGALGCVPPRRNYSQEMTACVCVCVCAQFLHIVGTQT